MANGAMIRHPAHGSRAPSGVPRYGFVDPVSIRATIFQRLRQRGGRQGLSWITVRRANSGRRVLPDGRGRKPGEATITAQRRPAPARASPSARRASGPGLAGRRPDALVTSAVSRVTRTCRTRPGERPHGIRAPHVRPEKCGERRSEQGLAAREGHDPAARESTSCTSRATLPGDGEKQRHDDAVEPNRSRLGPAVPGSKPRNFTCSSAFSPLRTWRTTRPHARRRSPEVSLWLRCSTAPSPIRASSNRLAGRASDLHDRSSSEPPRPLPGRQAISVRSGVVSSPGCARYQQRRSALARVRTPSAERSPRPAPARPRRRPLRPCASLSTSSFSAAMSHHFADGERRRRGQIMSLRARVPFAAERCVGDQPSTRPSRFASSSADTPRGPGSEANANA